MLVAAVLLAVVTSWRSSPSSPGFTLERATPPGASMPPPRLDIRTAPWYEWTLLRGVGAARARKIVSYRESIGGFRSIEDLERVPGMPSGWLEASRALLTVGER